MPKKAHKADRDNNGRELALTADRDGYFLVVLAGTRVKVASGVVQPLGGSVGKILDIKSNQEDMGIGSRLLIFMEEWAKSNGINRLVGILSSEDVDHIEKLKHVYGKHGYSVNLRQDWADRAKHRGKQIGAIAKDLT